MIQDVRIPEISENVESGDVGSILVQVGDQVEKDQGLLELETEKAVVELPSPFAGTVKEILVSEGDEVNVGDVVVKIDTEGEGKAEKEEEAQEEKKEEPEETGEQQEEEPKREKEEPEEEEKEEEAEEKPKKEKAAAKPEKKEEPKREEKKAKSTEEDDRVQPPPTFEPPTPRDRDELKTSGEPAPAGPSVRKLARELGVDLHQVGGTGPRGRIFEDDVKKYAKQQVQAAAAGPATAQAQEIPDLSKWGEVEAERMSKVRKLTAEAMANAWSTVPHVTQFQKADGTAFEEFRQSQKKYFEKHGVKLTPTAIMLKIVAEALRKFPKFNAAIDMRNQQVIYRKYVHISVAVDTDRGLLVPVVRDVDKKNLLELAGDLGDLSQKARDRKITAEEMEGGGFTISNQGSIGGEWFTPIVSPPQVAILGVSQSMTEPRWINGEWVPRNILPLTLSYDHRLIDGADAARFLDWICKAIEQPLNMFV